MSATAKKIDGETWVFEDGGVRFFLLTGSEKALLIDSGMQTRNAKDLAEELTNLPVSLLNTHADRDHTASNHQFGSFYMNMSECSNYYNSQGGSGEILPIEHGDVIDLGERRLIIIGMPGHTPGSVAVLDEKYRRLFAGDPVQDGRIFMFGVQRELHAYRHSLQRLKSFENMFDEIYPSHGSCPVKPELIDKLYQASGQIISGELTGEEDTVFGSPVTVYKTPYAAFLCDPKPKP